MMIKIAYDYQAFTLQKYGGVSRYICALASEVAKNNDFDVKVYAGLYQNKYLEDYSNLSVKGWQVSNLPIPRRILDPINTKLNKFSFSIDCPDIVHETYYNSQRTTLEKTSVIITVHDMIHEKFLNLTQYKDFIKDKARAIKRADRVVCVSENTRRDLLEIYNLDPKKVVTIYTGHSPLPVQKIDIDPIVKDPYILYVGSRSSTHKNFNALLQAYSNSKQLRSCFKLVCFGTESFSSDEINNMKKMSINVERDVLHYSGSDSILVNLYTNASVFIYPSLYEGFGIPPLEAMSLNCPVACSNASSIPEIVGDAGEYFDPQEIDSIITAIEKVVCSTAKSKELKAKGRERVKLFSWEKCAAETSVLYRSAS
jgi:glycosyltransferase involved in cell wall biosynthesis